MVSPSSVNAAGALGAVEPEKVAQVPLMHDLRLDGGALFTIVDRADAELVKATGIPQDVTQDVGGLDEIRLRLD